MRSLSGSGGSPISRTRTPRNRRSTCSNRRTSRRSCGAPAATCPRPPVRRGSIDSNFRRVLKKADFRKKTELVGAVPRDHRPRGAILRPAYEARSASRDFVLGFGRFSRALRPTRLCPRGPTPGRPPRFRIRAPRSRRAITGRVGLERGARYEHGACCECRLGPGNQRGSRKHCTVSRVYARAMSRARRAEPPQHLGGSGASARDARQLDEAHFAPVLASSPRWRGRPRSHRARQQVYSPKTEVSLTSNMGLAWRVGHRRGDSPLDLRQDDQPLARGRSADPGGRGRRQQAEEPGQAWTCARPSSALQLSRDSMALLE